MEAGGDAEHVLECFRKWKFEPLIYRRDRLMFEGRGEVGVLCHDQFGDLEQARKALETFAILMILIRWPRTSTMALASPGS
jgi:hypothetical protein